MIDPKQIKAYCEEQGWACSTTHGKKNGKRTIYPSVWRTDKGKHLSNWWTIVIYRDEMDFTEMTKIMDEAFKTITAEYSRRTKMIKHCKFYTSVKSGVTMSRKGWLQLISKRDFGRELFLCMTNPRLLEAVVARFEKYKQSGIFVPAVKEA